MNEPIGYFQNPNTVFNRAAWFDIACAKISKHIGKTRHSIGWNGQHYIVFIESHFWYFWHRHITGKFEDTDEIKYLRQKI